MILNFNEKNVESIIYDLIENFIPLANNNKGLCVIKRIIQKSKNEIVIKKVLKILNDNALSLVQNPYGNYALQAALEVTLLF